MAAILKEAKGRDEFATARYFSKWLRQRHICLVF